MQPEVEEDETLDLSAWRTMVEGMYNRAGLLKRKLMKDKERVSRKMKVIKRRE